MLTAFFSAGKDKDVSGHCACIAITTVTPPGTDSARQARTCSFRATGASCRGYVCSALSFGIGTHIPYCYCTSQRHSLVNRSRREHEKLPASVGGVKAFGQKTHGVHWHCHFKFRPRLMYPNHDGTFAPMRIRLL